ncbi:MAG: EAL domain-containing protein [Humidesulfovibrio sp.]|uniref:two-component system response regulator n=1 Tax=Humidesulfovibrio sp. TaxID=2910988 RepID=UPI002732653C|nr:GGDEF and EAL domain-containing protein [Humidesulfovibrio sp.]MDP2848315.1 EAL domain-containing protein [Humidesulfovibrio sp.]
MGRAEYAPEVIDILAVDDEQVNLLLLTGLLRREGVNVVTARSGYEALKLLDTHDFALILLDVMMPGLDGFTTAERIRSDENTRHIPIIFITAISKEQRHVFKGYEAGAVDYLIKPFEHEILKNKVQVFVDMHRQRLAVQRASEALAKTVDELRSSTKALSDSRTRYQSLFTSMFNGFALLSPGDEPQPDLAQARILEINPAMEQILGLPREALLERTMGEILPNLEGYLRDFATEVVRSGKSGLIESYLSDIKRWLRIQAYVPGPGLLAMVAEDITARRKAEETLQERTFRDPLTGLANRALFMDRLEQSMERSRRRLNYLYAVLFLDLDRFKPINSSLGHAAGDKVLRAVAERIKGVARGLDTVARCGADEFALILEELKGPGEALRVARRICDELARPMELHGNALHFTASIGVVLGPADYAQPEELLQDAGIAMEHARTLGGGKVKVFKWAMRTRAQYALNVNQSLHHALDRQQFRLHYQPIFNLKDNTLAGFEALIRWQVDGRLVPPGDFIPHAEQTGLIVPIGQWAIAETCAMTAQWEERFALPKGFNVAVNLSAKQFSQPDLMRQLTRALEENHLDPQRLKLEITETLVMQNPESVVHKLRGLREMGVKVSIDDFGTGYSSLSYLRRFPINTLKIDRSFVSDLDAFENLIIVRTIVSLAHNLGFDVVAEGIETERQRHFLAELNCEFGQGFLFSRALTEEKALELLSVCCPKPGLEP